MLLLLAKEVPARFPILVARKSRPSLLPSLISLIIISILGDARLSFGQVHLSSKPLLLSQASPYRPLTSRELIEVSPYLFATRKVLPDLSL